MRSCASVPRGNVRACSSSRASAFAKRPACKSVSARERMATSSARRSELRRELTRAAGGVAGALAAESAASALGAAGGVFAGDGDGAVFVSLEASTLGAGGAAAGAGLFGARSTKTATPALAIRPAAIAESAGQPSPPPLAAAGAAGGWWCPRAPVGRRAPSAANVRARSLAVGLKAARPAATNACASGPSVDKTKLLRAGQPCGGRVLVRMLGARRAAASRPC